MNSIKQSPDYKKGFAAGKKKGFAAGEKTGFTIGKKKGFTTGKKTGFAKGKKKGFAHGKTYGNYMEPRIQKVNGLADQIGNSLSSQIKKHMGKIEFYRTQL